MPKIAYTDEFKRDAVALVASGIPQKQVAKGRAGSGTLGRRFHAMPNTSETTSSAASGPTRRIAKALTRFE